MPDSSQDYALRFVIEDFVALYCVRTQGGKFWEATNSITIGSFDPLYSASNAHFFAKAKCAKFSLSFPSSSSFFPFPGKKTLNWRIQRHDSRWTQMWLFARMQNVFTRVEGSQCKSLHTIRCKTPSAISLPLYTHSTHSIVESTRPAVKVRTTRKYSS